MRGSTRLLCGGVLYAASLFLGAGFLGAGPASADCVRHVYNRSPLVLVATQEGGPAITVRPGASRAIRLARPGALSLAGYCPLPGPRVDPSAFGPPVVQETFDYQAVQDRCYFTFGQDFFDRELGRGFLPRPGTQPFTLNAPKQGDVVLYTDAAACLSGR